MAVKKLKGNWKTKWFRKAASTVLVVNSFLEADGSGAVQPADASSTAIVGICKKAVVATDADYADNTRIPVLIPADETAQFIADVGTGTMATSLEATLCDLKDADELDVSATSVNVVALDQFVSTTKAIGRIAKLFGDN